MSEATSVNAATATRGSSVRAMDPKAKIQFGVYKDAEGKEKKYGPGNCPFREGSVRAGQWPVLRAGMTVEKAVEGGVPRHRLNTWAEKGYITIGA